VIQAYLAEPKVSQFDVASIGEQNIVWFKVTMNYPVAAILVLINVQTF
jgi:hypothetical protein